MSLEISPSQPRASQPPPAPPSLTGILKGGTVKTRRRWGIQAEQSSEVSREVVWFPQKWHLGRSQQKSAAAALLKVVCRSAPHFSTRLCPSNFHFIFKTRTLKMPINRSEAHRAEPCINQVGFVLFFFCFSFRGRGNSSHQKMGSGGTLLPPAPRPRPGSAVPVGKTEILPWFLPKCTMFVLCLPFQLQNLTKRWPVYI